MTAMTLHHSQCRYKTCLANTNALLFHRGAKGAGQGVGRVGSQSPSSFSGCRVELPLLATHPKRLHCRGSIPTEILVVDTCEYENGGGNSTVVAGYGPRK